MIRVRVRVMFLRFFLLVPSELRVLLPSPPPGVWAPQRRVRSPFAQSSSSSSSGYISRCVGALAGIIASHLAQSNRLLLCSCSCSPPLSFLSACIYSWRLLRHSRLSRLVFSSGVLLLRLLLLLLLHLRHPQAHCREVGWLGHHQLSSSLIRL